MKREELKQRIEAAVRTGNPLFPNRTAEQILILVDEYTNEIRGLTKPKEKDLEERKWGFRMSVKTHHEEYGLLLLQEFCDYWTEHNEGGKKMRFEMSKNQPFNIKRRLVTWAKNQKKFNNGATTTKADQANDWHNG